MGSPGIYHMEGIPALPIEYGKWSRQIHIGTVCLIFLLMEKMVSPGNLKVTLVYSLGEDDNALDLTYEATTDAPTVLNLSHHSFFNISGILRKAWRTSNFG